MVAPHLALGGYIKVIKTDLSSTHPVVSIASRGVANNTWVMESMQTRSILYTCVLSVATSGMSHHKSKVIL